MYEMISSLSTIGKILVFTSVVLLTMTITFTILDYTSKAKHINKDGW